MKARYFLLAAPVSLFAFLPAVLHALHPGADPPHRTELRSEGSFPLDFSYPVPVVEARINGRGPFKLILDTGSAAGLLLDQKIAEQVGLHATRGIGVDDASHGASQSANVATVDSVTLGPATFFGVECVYWAHALPFDAPDPPVGVIGLPMLSELLVTLDYPARRAWLTRGALPNPDGVHTIAYELAGGVPEIPIQVAGVPLRTHIDSGSSGELAVPGRYRETLPLSAPVESSGRTRTVTHETAVTSAPISGDLLFGGRTYPQPRLQFSDRLEHLNLGSGLLRDFVVTVDQKRRRIRLVPNPALPAIAAPAPVRLYGIQFRQDPALPMHVDAVLPGSPAERGGLLAGDDILRIDGRPTHEMDAFDRMDALRRPTLRLTLRRGERELEVTLSLAP